MGIIVGMTLPLKASRLLCMGVTLLLLHALIGLVHAANSRPYATTGIHTVEAGASVEFSLGGFDVDTMRRSPPLQKTIEKKPTQGSLFDLTSNYAKYGYPPEYSETNGLVTTVPHTPRFTPRLFYRSNAASANLDGDMWDVVHYKVSDGALTSPPGVLYFVGPSRTMLGSLFGRDSAGWTIERTHGSHKTPVLQWDAYSRGSLVQYVHATDNIVESVGGTGRSAWFFVAPSKFHRDLHGAYGGTIEFDMAAFAGDFNRPHNDVKLVTLECSSCDALRGITLVVRASGDYSFSGTEKHFKVPLEVGAHLLKDPKNTLTTTWPIATQCEIIEVMQGLSAIRLGGDFTLSAETIALDNFKIVAPAVANVPVSCLCTNPGTRCE